MGREVHVDYTGEFESWWNRLTVVEQERLGAMVNLLRREGTALGVPQVVAGQDVPTQPHAGASSDDDRAGDQNLLRFRPATDSDPADRRPQDGAGTVPPGVRATGGLDL